MEPMEPPLSANAFTWKKKVINILLQEERTYRYIFKHIAYKLNFILLMIFSDIKFHFITRMIDIV